MTIHKMPIAWSDNRLALNPKQLVAGYRFRPTRDGFVYESPNRELRAVERYELAACLVDDGVEDGTVEIRWRSSGMVERFESLHGMAALLRTQLQRRSLNIPRERLQTLFRKSGRGLKPDVQEWWDDTFKDSPSRAWHLRQYLFSPNARRANRMVTTFLEFATDADMLVFKFRWPELWS
jgi:hypothetical protein